MRAEFVVIGKPQAKQRPRFAGHAYTPKETAMYENLVRLEYERQCKGVYFDEPFCMEVTATYEVPKSFSKKKREMALSGELKKDTKPDVDNIIKSVADALNELAYHDDALMYDVHVRKEYGETPKVKIVLYTEE